MLALRAGILKLCNYRFDSMATTNKNKTAIERTLLRWLLVFIPPLILVGVSVSIFAFLWKSEQQAADVRFQTRTNELAGDLEKTLTSYSDFIEATGGFFHSKQQINQAEFRSFVSKSLLRHSGFDMIGWAPASDAMTVTIHEPAMAATDFSTIAPDLLIQSRDSGRMVSSRPGETLESATNVVRVQLLAPVYAGQTQLPTIDSRRNDFRGFAVGVVNVNELVESALIEKGGDDILLTLSDETTTQVSNDLYCCDATLRHGRRHKDVYTIFGGRRWRMRFQSSQAFDESAHSWQPLLVAGAGLLLSLAIAAVLWLTTARTETFQRLVDERTADLKQANEKLQASTDQLAISNQALENSNTELQQYAYVASHDLQSPLRSVKAFSNMLSEDYHDKLDETAAEYIERIVEGVQRMQGMINDLLDYSRVESQGRPLKNADLNEIAKDAAAILDGVAKDENGAIYIHDLPEVACDRRQMVQLLQNLVGNGLKYRGEADPIIHVSAQRGEGEWIISVRDNGIGIDPKHHDQIFDIFRRLHNSSEYPGTGIGLAVCRRIVQRHNGRIWLESEKGAGCNFLFTIPDCEPPAEDVEATKEETSLYCSDLSVVS